MDRSESDWTQTVGLLVIEWSRLEERFPTTGAPGPVRVDISAVANASGISERQLRRVRETRNTVVHEPAQRPRLAEVDEALGVLELVWRSIDGNRPDEPANAPARELPVTESRGDARPDVYPNPRGDNAWDNDAVHWLLDQPDVAASFKRGPLMECLRCQPQRVKDQPHRVEEAARLARKHGVIQRQEFDEALGKRVVRLYRTDGDRPPYPGRPPGHDRP